VNDTSGAPRALSPPALEMDRWGYLAPRLLPEDRSSQAAAHGTELRQLRTRSQPKEKVMDMIVMPPNMNWSDLSAKEKVPFALRGILQFALLAAALADVYRRPKEEINGSKWQWSAVACVNFMGLGPIAYFAFGRKR